MSASQDPAPQPAPQASNLEAIDRGISPIAGRLGDGRGKILAFAALVVGCGVFLAATWGEDDPKPDRPRVQPARQVVPFEPARAEPPRLTPNAPPLLSAADAGPQVPALQPDGPPATGRAQDSEAQLAAIRSAPILAFSRTQRTSAASEVTDSVPASAAPTTPAARTELETLRQASAIEHARAFRLPDRNFLLVAGTAAPCILQTAMDTATPGFVSCVIPRDVYSDNGAVVLLEKGTKVLGEYRSSLRQGQKRFFVLWIRAVTPTGVAIALGSPAADALGRAGFDGAIDTHFWARFGGAALLSIVDDGAYALAGSENRAGAVRLPSEAAAIAAEESVNIAPTLRKAQGAEVSIFVAKDFDFSSVYGLQAP